MKSHLKTAEKLATLLDNKFSLGGIKFGLDPIFDFVPWLGDVVGLFLSCYLIWIGVRMHIPRVDLQKMIFNILIDFLIGLVPYLGIIGDIFYKANVRNIKILKKHDGRLIIEGEILS